MKGEFDREDSVLSLGFVLAMLAQVEIATIELFGYSAVENLADVAGLTVTPALLASFVILAVVFVTNDPNLSKLDQEYYAAAIATPVVILLVAWVPDLQDLATSEPLLGLGITALTGTGYAAISYLA